MALIAKENLNFELIKDGEYNTIHVVLDSNGTKNACISDKLPFSTLKDKLMVTINKIYVA